MSTYSDTVNEQVHALLSHAHGRYARIENLADLGVQRCLLAIHLRCEYHEGVINPDSPHLCHNRAAIRDVPDMARSQFMRRGDGDGGVRRCLHKQCLCMRARQKR